MAANYSRHSGRYNRDTAAIPGDSGRSPVPPMTHTSQLVRLLAHAAALGLAGRSPRSQTEANVEKWAQNEFIQGVRWLVKLVESKYLMYAQFVSTRGKIQEINGGLPASLKK